MNTVYEAIANYAMKFQVDAPGAEPTDEALRETLRGCALPPRLEWLPVIRLLLAPREGGISDVDLAFAYTHATAYARDDEAYGVWYATTYGVTADGLGDLPDHPTAWLRFQEALADQDDDPDDLS